MVHRLSRPCDGASSPIWKYAPHRAIIALGAVLIAIAVAGGLLGVANSGRAEGYATTLTNRYLVLLVATRQARNSVGDFQLVAERAFASGVNANLVTVGGQDSTITDQDYVTLHRLLSLPVNADLAPGLPALETIYANSRSGLSTLLTTGNHTPETDRATVVEQAAYQNLDTGLASLQDTLTTRLTYTADQARSAAADARNGLLLCLGFGVVLAVAITTVLARKARRVERDLAARDAAQALLTGRNEFEGRLQRALEMARAEPPVFDLVARALTDAAPDMRAELLLADSSRAHFRQVLVTPSDTDEQGCGVVSPEDCPAASRGQTMVFASSTAMDVCPNLRNRSCSALCVPVSISGNAVGVVHVTAPEGSPPGEAVSRDVEVVARRASERLAMLRAFEVSQTQANSDSLTGLLTRRSIESRVRKLQEEGVRYVLAYGDLDHFKELNDVFGHDAGDRALRTFSQVLRDALRPSDLPCRYGGEEFVIILPDCRIDEVVPVLDRVRQRIADRVAAGGVPTFTVSFGVASSEQAAHFEEVVNLADQALLQAKAAGRDQIVVARGAPDAGAVSVNGSAEAGDARSGAPRE